MEGTKTLLTEFGIHHISIGELSLLQKRQLNVNAYFDECALSLTHLKGVNKKSM